MENAVRLRHERSEPRLRGFSEGFLLAQPFYGWVGRRQLKLSPLLAGFPSMAGKHAKARSDVYFGRVPSRKTAGLVTLRESRVNAAEEITSLHRGANDIGDFELAMERSD